MGLYLASDGTTRVTAASVQTSTVNDPEVIVNQDLVQKRSWLNADDQSQNGGETVVYCRAGTVMRQSELNAMFKTIINTPLSPAAAPFATPTVVTVTGVNLDGITAVKVNGVAATALTVVTPEKFEFTTPAQAAAGTYDVVFTADDGDHTLPGAFVGQ